MYYYISSLTSKNILVVTGAPCMHACSPSVVANSLNPGKYFPQVPTFHSYSCALAKESTCEQRFILEGVMLAVVISLFLKQLVGRTKIYASVAWYTTSLSGPPQNAFGFPPHFILH